MSEPWTIGKSRFKRPIQTSLAAVALLYVSWLSFDAADGVRLPPDPASVSYTHLTLPTICSV